MSLFGGDGNDMDGLDGLINSLSEGNPEVRKQMENLKKKILGEYEQVGFLDKNEVELFNKMKEASKEAQKSVSKMKVAKDLFYATIRSKRDLGERNIKIEEATTSILAEKEN